MLKCERLLIPDVLVLTPDRFRDVRGFFSETYSHTAMASLGVLTTFVQDNHSLSERTGTLRGLHFQAPPFAQAKLVRVTRGSILDVTVDLRRGSATFGQHVKVNLGEQDGRQIYVPAGFAHGFLTLEPHTEVQYKVSAPYSAQSDRGLAWNDPDLAIDWGINSDQVLLSDKDTRQPFLRDLTSPFD
jgi:dTDP-4-dehydrorhamnose 3,5-epimerase